jgi:REP element-mobilizing transposase RayT
LPVPSITSWRAEIDGKRFSRMIEIGAERYRVKVYCYVLMENHFHLVVMSPEGNLSQWMHPLKTAYTVYFNRRHRVVGHLFQGRFKSPVIEAEINGIKESSGPRITDRRKTGQLSEPSRSSSG